MDRARHALLVAAEIEHDVAREVDQHDAARLGCVEQRQPLGLAGGRRHVDRIATGATLVGTGARQLEAERCEHIEHEARAVAPSALVAPAIRAARVLEGLSEKARAGERPLRRDELGRAERARAHELVGRRDPDAIDGGRAQQGAGGKLLPLQLERTRQRKVGPPAILRFELLGQRRRQCRIGSHEAERVACAREPHAIADAAEQLDRLLRARLAAAVAVESLAARLGADRLRHGHAAQVDGRQRDAQLALLHEARIGARELALFVRALALVLP
jgi:hypothetical protein